MNARKQPLRAPANNDIAKRKTMTTLMAGDCRWPIGDPQKPGFHFCGARKQAGHPYCEFHARLASTPSRPRTYRREVT